MDGSRATKPRRHAARSRPASRPARRGVAWLGVALLGACAGGPFVPVDTPRGVMLLNRDAGYAIARPAWASESGWRSIDLEDADLAYGNRQGTTISLAARCRKTSASVAALARHVTIGTERTVLHAAGPSAVGDAPAWTQSFDTERDGVTVHVKAVTAATGGCVYDWILVSPDAAVFDHLEPAFDDWVDSFVPPVGAVPDPRRAPVPSPGPPPAPPLESSTTSAPAAGPTGSAP